LLLLRDRAAGAEQHQGDRRDETVNVSHKAPFHPAARLRADRPEYGRSGRRLQSVARVPTSCSQAAATRSIVSPKCRARVARRGRRGTRRRIYARARRHPRTLLIADPET
jgi:hypothetical protein